MQDSEFLREMSQYGSGTPQYYLMNKDTIIAGFHLKHGEDIYIDDVVVKLPDWVGDLGAFISGRRAPKHRENIRELLKISGCDSIQGYLDITHALSLIDTFWVKPVDSDLRWEKISLFRNSFNETIAKTAFEGGLHGHNFSTTSPEYGTDGSFAKCWIRENDQIKMLKRGSSGAANAGLEPYSEFYASQLAKELVSDYVDYDLRTTGGRICSVCDIFTSEELGYLPYHAVEPGNSTHLTVLRKCEELGFFDRAAEMFVLDYVILNEDRHKSNFGFLVDNAKQEIVGFAPMFDHNISLLPYAMEDDFEDLDKYLEPKGPRLAQTFIQSARSCLTPSLRKKLINLTDFKFARHPKFNLPEWRLTALENLIHENIKILLQVRG